MPKIKDLTGQRFGRLTVKGFSQKDRHNKGHWVCQCDCGNVVDVETHQLKSGKTKSCGCLKSEKTRERVKTHGDTGSRLYWVWAAIIQRCTNPANAAYNNYGGRGIKVCEEWQNSFETFRDWALANGYRQGQTIDRQNNNGDYCPDNCRLADRKTQNNNKRNTKQIEFMGERHSVTEWARIIGVDRATIRKRHAAGLPLDIPIKRTGRPKGSRNKQKT